MSDSIFKEVAFTPHIFQKEFLLTDKRKFERFLGILDNLAQSGQIIGVFNDWFRFVNENISQFDEFDKDEIKEILKYLTDRQRIVHIQNEKCDSYDETSWIQQAIKLNTIRTFELILATHQIDQIKSLDNMDRATLRSIQNMGAAVLPQSEDNMRKILAPILAYAEIVKVYDPYFDLSVRRYTDALKIILELFGFGHGTKESSILEIHTSIKVLLDRNNLLNWKNISSYTKQIEDLEKQYNHSIKIFIWEEKENNRWHDRWIVTNQCAITLGKGSDISEWTDATWGLLDYEQIPNVQKKFNQNRNEYNLVTTIDRSSIKKENKSLMFSEPKTEEEIKEKLQNKKRYCKETKTWINDGA